VLGRKTSGSRDEIADVIREVMFVNAHKRAETPDLFAAPVILGACLVGTLLAPAISL
jgi:hypothetical protein